MKIKDLTPKTIIMEPDKYKAINPQGESLTAEKLCTFKGFETYSNNEAQIVVDALITLAGIIVRNCLRMNNKAKAEPQVISLTPGKEQTKKAV